MPIHAFVVTHITLTTITCMRPLYDRLPVGSRSRLRSYIAHPNKGKRNKCTIIIILAIFYIVGENRQYYGEDCHND